MTFRTVLRIEFALRAGLELVALLWVLLGVTPPGLNGHLLFQGNLDGILAALLLTLLMLNAWRDIQLWYMYRGDDEDGDEVV